MSKQGSSKQHLELRNVQRTWFRWAGAKHTVREATPEAFDGWIRQFVEEIVNVDTAKWSVFQRWNIVNAVLKEGLMVITKLPGGDTLEPPPLPESEVDASEQEAQPEIKNTPENASVAASEA